MERVPKLTDRISGIGPDSTVAKWNRRHEDYRISVASNYDNKWMPEVEIVFLIGSSVFSYLGFKWGYEW